MRVRSLRVGIASAAGAALLAVTAAAQDDRVRLVDGEPLEGVTIVAFDVRRLECRRDGAIVVVPTERIAAIESGQHAEVFRRALAANDAEALRTLAREQAAKSPLLLQTGMLAALELAVAGGRDREAIATFDELRRLLPDAGVLPAMLRARIDRGLLVADAVGVQAAQAAVQRWQTEAAGWPPALQLEGEWWSLLVAWRAAPDARAAVPKLRELAGRAHGSVPTIAARAHALLALALLQDGDVDGARAAAQPIVDAVGADATARGLAWRALAGCTMHAAGVDQREPWRQATLQLLRVRLEAREAPAFVQADALAAAIDAAAHWGGEDSRAVVARCRWLLQNDFAGAAVARQVQER